MPDVRFSFEPSDIVNEVMSFGSPTPVEIAVSGPEFADNRAYAAEVWDEARRHSVSARSASRPVARLPHDRSQRRSREGGSGGIDARRCLAALVTATSSSRFVVPNYWADPKSGIAYQVQVEIPRPVIRTPDNVTTIGSAAQIGADSAEANRPRANPRWRRGRIARGTMPGQYDRYNMRRQITLTANVADADLGTVSREVAQAIQRAGAPPAGVQVETRGQIPPMREMQSGLADRPGPGRGRGVFAA